VEGGGFQVEPPGTAPTAAQVLVIRRTTRAAGRAMLKLRIQGQDQDLLVPLAYLPASPAVKSSARARPGAAGPRRASG
jgi:hypothetical protein